MTKKKVVLASVLKPINDTRMFEKMGQSLAATNKYDVNIIGFQANKTTSKSNIKFHPVFAFHRLSINRFFAGNKFYYQLKKIKPDLIIINTHELLWPAILYRLLYGSKVCYDVQENHFRNILFTDSFPLLVRPFLAAFVRTKEYLTYPFISHYFLAETYYSKELHFIGNNFTILENKALKISNELIEKSDPKKNLIQLLFSGTLAESTGVFGAINLAKKLHEIEPKIQLKIIGYSPRSSVIEQIKKTIKNDDFIQLIGGENLVDHEKIIKEIHQADFGIIYYPSNKSTINSTPTKLYEYLTYCLPILIQSHTRWKEIGDKLNAFIEIDFNNIDAVSILDQIKMNEFYSNGSNTEFQWETEEQKLVNRIEKILL